MAAKETEVIKKAICPKIEEAFKSTKIRKAYKDLLNQFMTQRSEELYDTLPCSRLICGEEEMDKLFTVLGIAKEDVTNAILATYYGPMSNFNPRAAKHEFTVLCLSVLRYFILKKDKQMAELTMLYLSFSGKFYPSIHYRSYPVTVPVRYVMEYVVNNSLSQKYDLASYGSVIGAIKSVGTTWMTSYNNRFKNYEDEDAVYLIQQLHSRIGSFMINIAEEYYKVYEEKDVYMNYTSDSLDPDNYHLADSDSLKAQRYAEAAVNYITTYGVNYKICESCSDSNITPNEVRAVIESIINRRENILEIKELISLMIVTYFAQTKNREKNVTDIAFISYSIIAKPNAKQKELVRQKEIIENWLSESGTAYLRRRSRDATRNSYEKAVKLYFALSIHNANR